MTKNKKTNYSRGIVFGVFDGLHPGHKYFLREAAKKCNELIVVVAQTEVVKFLKKHSPKYSLKERVFKIKELEPNFIVVPGDSVLGKWSALKKYSPDVVFLGHDQQEISKDLKKRNTPCIFIESHYPEKYKSSFI